MVCFSLLCPIKKFFFLRKRFLFLFPWEKNLLILFFSVHLQAWTKYLRKTLVLMSNNTLLENFNFYFSAVFASINKIFILGDDWLLGYNSNFMMFWDFSDLSWFPDLSWSLISFGNSWGNSYIPCLLLIITLRSTCGEKKVWQSIKKSQNIMSIIVGRPYPYNY